jgi:hypothetical protein
MPAIAGRNGPNTAVTTPMSDFAPAFRTACARGVLVCVVGPTAPAQRTVGRRRRDLIARTADALDMPIADLHVLLAIGRAGGYRRPDGITAIIRDMIWGGAAGVVVASRLTQLARTVEDLDLLLDDAARHDVWLFVDGYAVRPADPADRLILRMLALHTGQVAVARRTVH